MRLAFLALVLAACGSSESSSDGGVPTIRASDFDQSCAQNADCVAVEDDTPCCNICPNAAINAGALAAFDADWAKQAALCTPQDRQCASIACNTAEHAACSNGTCVFVHCSGSICPDADAGADAPSD